METKACPVCRAAGPVFYAQGRDRLFDLVPGIFNLYRCRECGCVFQFPMPEDSALQSFYPDRYWWSEERPELDPSIRIGKLGVERIYDEELQGTSWFARLFNRMEELYREFVVADHVRFLRTCAGKGGNFGKLLLDIGCGSGTFLHVARRYGFLPHGMDASPRAVEIAGKLYDLPVRCGEIGSEVWSDCRFDLVTMFHVLEHLPDPGLGLRFARRLLKPTGMLIVQVPNLASIQARVLGRCWYGLDVPRHLINFTPKGLGLLLSREEFEFELVSRFSLRDDPASILSSILLPLDPVRRKVRGREQNPFFSGVKNLAYLCLLLLALPLAFVESALGAGGSIWAVARPKPASA